MEGMVFEHERRVPSGFQQSEIERELQAHVEKIRRSDTPALERANFLGDLFRRLKDISDDSTIDAAQSILNDARALLEKDDEQFVKRISANLANFFQKLYQQPDGAQRLRSSERKERDRIIGRSVPLSPNHVLFGNIVDTQFEIHVAPAKTLTPVELLTDFKEGMRSLAHLLRDDPGYRNVDTVIGTSWLAGEHPKLAAQLGFTLGETLSKNDGAKRFIGEKRLVQSVTMSKDALLAKYG